MRMYEPDRSISMLADLPKDLYWFFKRLFRKFRRREMVVVSGFVFQETEDAFLLRINGVVSWIPKSFCKVISRKGKAIDLKISKSDYEKKFEGK